MFIKKLDLKENKKTITDFFYNVFTKEPWCDDWSDENQLNSYIEDLAGQSNSLNYGFFEETGEMLGLALGSIRHWFQGTEYHVDEFCVRIDVQGKGIGTSFMEAIQKEVLEMKIQRIYLETDLHAPAFKFYKKRGFVYLQDHVALSKNLVSL